MKGNMTMSNRYPVPPKNSDYINIKRSEYDDLVELAKLAGSLEVGRDNNEKIKSVKVRLEIMRRKRKL